MIRVIITILFSGYYLYLSAQTTTIQYLGNEGVFIYNDKVKILIDPLYKEDFDSYQLVSTEAQLQIRKAQGIYKDVDFLLITHHHREHFDEAMILEHLKNNTKCTFIASTQAVELLKKHNNWQANFSDRIIALQPEMNKEIKTLDFPGLKLSAMWIRHGYERNFGVINLTYLLELNGKKLAHFGDTELVAEHFQAFRLWEKKIDVALMPFWFINNENNIKIVQQVIAPKQSVGIHITKDYDKWVKKVAELMPKAIIFKSPSDKITF
ncbi:MAG: MBL fold metallo-hydrolase [Saprospiraceae bacterium]|nr:MBL fold metallo-hydrolase [Saprospiraceae bacterium]